jgi:MFS family permease
VISAPASTTRAIRPVLIPRELRADPALRTGALAAALYMASVGAEFFLLTLLLQEVSGYSPMRTGLAFLPLAASVTVGSTTAGRWLRTRPAPTVLAGGFALSAAGLAWIATAAGGGYLTGLLPGLIASGVGHGIVYTSMFTLGTARAPAAHQGTAGALVTTAQYVAGAIAVALLTLLLGPEPHQADFRLAFAATAAAAVAGTALAVRAARRV